jgi:hypothetical protein
MMHSQVESTLAAIALKTGIAAKRATISAKYQDLLEGVKPGT